MFVKGFDNYVCDGDKITCEVDGFTITARIVNDDDGSPPPLSGLFGPLRGPRPQSGKCSLRSRH